MSSEVATSYREGPALRGSLSLIASVAVHVLLFACVVGTTRERSRRSPDPTVEITVLEVAHSSAAPEAPQEARSKASKVFAKRLLQTATTARIQPEPEKQSVVALTLPLAPPASEGAQDGGTPVGLSGSALDGVPGGTRDGEDQPITGPSFGAAYLHNPPPRYPAIARRMQLQGTATIRVLVSPEGRPQHVAVEKSSGVQLLDEAALEAVRQWSFVPARQGDKAIAAEVNVPLRFRLSGAAVVLPDAPDFN